MEYLGLQKSLREATENKTKVSCCALLVLAVLCCYFCWHWCLEMESKRAQANRLSSILPPSPHKNTTCLHPTCPCTPPPSRTLCLQLHRALQETQKDLRETRRKLNQSEQRNRMQRAIFEQAHEKKVCFALLACLFVCLFGWLFVWLFVCLFG